MLHISKSLRSRIAIVASAGITGALLVASPLIATAAPTVITYTSTAAVDYPQLAAVGGPGGVSWAPFPEEENNAPGMSGALNWGGRSGWTKNFVVQDDGSGTNGALYVHKAQAGVANSGIQVAALANGQSLISSSNKKITFKAKAADANVPVQATLSDYYGGHVMVVNATLKNAGAYNTVTLDFGRPASGTYASNFSYTNLSIVFDPANAIAGNVHADWGHGPVGATLSKLYIMDNLTYTLATGATQATSPDVARLLTFEAADKIGVRAVGDPVDGSKWAGAFGGSGTGISDPTTPRTLKALQFAKGVANAWSGVNLFESPVGEVITSAAYKTVSMDFFSPETTDIPVMVKLIPVSGDTLIRAVTAVPGWSTLTFDFGAADGPGVWNADAKYKQLSLFPNFNEAGVGPSTATAAALGSIYFIDNVAVNGYALATTTSTPSYTLSPAVGTTVNAAAVTWTGNAVKVGYKWYRCSVLGATARVTLPLAEDKCSAISGATKASYKLTSSDKGRYIRVAVTGTTTAGTVSVLAPSTAKVG
ncbi:MAG: hypothetical protein RL197_698 [Actinomycetota bacterium]|jgi:hypothetical protein